MIEQVITGDNRFNPMLSFNYLIFSKFRIDAPQHQEHRERQWLFVRTLW